MTFLPVDDEVWFSENPHKPVLQTYENDDFWEHKGRGFGPTIVQNFNVMKSTPSSGERGRTRH